MKELQSYNICHSPAMAFSFVKTALLLLLLVGVTSCGNSDVKLPEEYTGPLREIEKVETYYTEKNLVKVKMMADLVYEFENGDQEFPKGMYLEFYDDFGKMSSTLRANHAYFFKKENQWRGRGKVEVRNIQKNEQLNTEELFWKPSEERIFTDKFVTIRQESDVIYGEGLEAKQDMSDYVITKPTGEIHVEEE